MFGLFKRLKSDTVRQCDVISRQNRRIQELELELVHALASRHRIVVCCRSVLKGAADGMRYNNSLHDDVLGNELEKIAQSLPHVLTNQSCWADPHACPERASQYLAFATKVLESRGLRMSEDPTSNVAALMTISARLLCGDIRLSKVVP